MFFTMHQQRPRHLLAFIDPFLSILYSHVRGPEMLCDGTQLSRLPRAHWPAPMSQLLLIVSIQRDPNARKDDPERIADGR